MIVVDTNVLLYRWFESRGPDETDRINALIRRGGTWAAPRLWRSEFRNVLSRHVVAGRLSPSRAVFVTECAASCLTGGEYTVNDDAVFRLAEASGCTAYDCEFVAVAEALGTFLVTEDRQLQAAFPRRCRGVDAALRGGR